MTETTMAPSRLLNEWDTDELRYSFVWEDHRNLALAAAEGLGRPVGRVLSIGSSGDNALALLMLDPREVVVIDLSPAQMALVELKVAAVAALDHDAFMDFFWTDKDGHAVYEKLRSFLSPGALRHWDARRESFARGIHSSGRLDSYFRKFREQGLSALWSTEDLRTMSDAKDVATQVRAWQKADASEVRRLASDFFSRTALSMEGRHASQFSHVQQEDIGPLFLRNFARLLQSVPCGENPYMHYFLTGRALRSAGTHPLWDPVSFAMIKSRVSRLKFVVRDLESQLGDENEPFDLMNLSDIFEYLSEDETQKLFAALAEKLSPGGLLAYWTLLVDRAPVSARLSRDEALSKKLTVMDRTWFYSGFHVAKRM